MQEKKKLSLFLNKTVIEQLDKTQADQIKGGADGFLSIWGSNCRATNPSKHECCTGVNTEAYHTNQAGCTQMP